jgi:hypothetical protein
MDSTALLPFYQRIQGNLEAVVGGYDWREYDHVFMTTPSWFVTVATEEIVRLAGLIRRASPGSRLYFFGNSVGTWTDAETLERHDIRLRHLNDLTGKSPGNRPIDYDRLPVPLYEKRDRYLFDLLPFRLKHGCPWGKCRFCSLAKGWNSGYLERDPHVAVREIEELIERYHPKMLVCRDNSINGDNLMEFCRHFNPDAIPWAAMARADLGEEEISALARSGCRVVYFGLESGSDRVLRRINKGLTASQMSAFIKALHRHDVMPAPSCIVGYPGETDENFEETVHFVTAHRDYFNILNVFPVMPTPASDLEKERVTPGPEVFMRLLRLAAACGDAGIRVCVGEQSEEYLVCKWMASANQQDS